MKLLTVLPLVVLFLTACSTPQTAPTAVGDQKKVEKAERIADHMESRLNHR